VTWLRNPKASRQQPRHIWPWVLACLAGVICLVAFFSGESAQEQYKKQCQKGWDHVGAGQYELAANSFSEAILIEPGQPDAYEFRGAVHLALGRYRLGIDSLDQSIRLIGKNPKAAWSYYLRGYCYQALGDRQRGLEDYRTAAELGCKEANAGLQRFAEEMK